MVESTSNNVWEGEYNRRVEALEDPTTTEAEKAVFRAEIEVLRPTLDSLGIKTDPRLTASSPPPVIEPPVVVKSAVPGPEPKPGNTPPPWQRPKTNSEIEAEIYSISNFSV